jgi:predicted 3-demethylubiquinone-9 3-methyltransferase (glyoxalase superfamily)
MIQEAIPFLMFQGEAGPALEFYATALERFELLNIEHWGPGEAAPEGQVKSADFAVAGQRFRCFDSPPVHAFDFTPSFSIFLECDRQEDVDQLAATLGAGGKTMMPPDDYGFSPRFAWVSDRFKVSWQINFVEG